MPRLLRGKNVVDNFNGDFGPFELNKDRMKYVLPSLDPRIHFVLCQHNVSSPPIRVLTPHTIDAHLEAAASEYFEKQIVIETNRYINSLFFFVLSFFLK